MDYIEALKYATEKHKDTPRRKGGEEYITHPVAVSEILRDKGFGTDVQIMALFHDLLEDTDATESEILELSNQEVLDGVKLITKEEDYDMDDYINRIQSNQKACAVKLADRIHNLLSSVNAPEEWRHEYYLETLDYFCHLCEKSFSIGDIGGQVFMDDFIVALNVVFSSFSVEMYCS